MIRAAASTSGPAVRHHQAVRAAATTCILVVGGVAVSAETICEQRALARQLREDKRSGEALSVLDAAASQLAGGPDAAALRLDRAEVLLDLWRVPLAQAEIAQAALDLEAGGPSQDGSCGDPASEAPIRALELTARASRVEGQYADAATEWTLALSRRRGQQPPHTAALVRSLVLASDAFWLAGDIATSDRLCFEALALARSVEPPDEVLLARAIEGAGMQASGHGEQERAATLYEQALESSIVTRRVRVIPFRRACGSRSAPWPRIATTC